MKILIVHASAGAGHRIAAEALYEGLKDSSTHSVTLIDALDYTNPVFKSLYPRIYKFLITYLPSVWGLAFKILDIPSLLPMVRFFRRLQNSFHCARLQKFMIEEEFDRIISTHFMPNEVASYLKHSGMIKAKLVSCVTDFDVHSIWVAEHIDLYCVACDWTKHKIKQLGVDESKVAITGIPTYSKFHEQHDRVGLKEKLGLKQNVFTILIATGSFGIGPIEQIIRELDGFQVVVVCGHNKHLFQRLSRLKKNLVKVCGLVDNMDELMCVADVMITKPGGLSISEALVSQLPLIFFNAIPGQETSNIHILKEYSIGVSNVPVKEMAEILKQYQSSHDDFLTAVKATQRLAKPSAVNDVISQL